MVQAPWCMRYMFLAHACTNQRGCSVNGDCVYCTIMPLRTYDPRVPPHIRLHEYPLLVPTGLGMNICCWGPSDLGSYMPKTYRWLVASCASMHHAIWPLQCIGDGFVACPCMSYDSPVQGLPGSCLCIMFLKSRMYVRRYWPEAQGS
jgi:hypothetical protein